MTSIAYARRNALAAVSSLAATLVWGQTPASTFPARSVTLVVPYAAGGGTDIVGRLMARRLSELWGQAVVVDNRTGAKEL